MSPTVTVRQIGREAQPVAIIDDFAPDPAALRAAAIAARFGPATQHYPGLRAALPDSYLPTQRPILAAVLRDVFGHDGAVEVIDASFSMVTRAPAALTLRQRLPHCDAFAAGRIALVHHLSPEPRDGTAFFRHRASGFETIDEARAPLYLDTLAAELREHGSPPAAYVGADTPLFERIALVEPRPNRALVYRSFALHSGAIAADARLSPDPAVGRLTVTGFLSLGKGG